MIMKNSKTKEVCKDKNNVKRNVKHHKRHYLTDIFCTRDTNKQNSKIKEAAERIAIAKDIKKVSKAKTNLKLINKGNLADKPNSKIKEVADNAIDTNNEKLCEKIEVKTNVKQAKRGNLTNKQNSKIKEVADKAIGTKNIEKVCEKIKVKTNVKHAKRGNLTNVIYTKDMNKRKRGHSHKKSDNITTVWIRRIMNEKVTSCMKKLYDYSDLCKLIASDIKNAVTILDSALNTVTNGEKFEKSASMSQQDTLSKEIK